MINIPIHLVAPNILSVVLVLMIGAFCYIAVGVGGALKHMEEGPSQ